MTSGPLSRRGALLAAALAAAAFAVVPVTAGANPAGRTTLSQTIRIAPGTGFRSLVTGPGEPYVLRQGSLGRAAKARSRTRRSLLFFGQITDVHIVDEMSPPRVDFVDPAGPPLQSAQRPQEAFSTQVADQMVRNMNADRTSPVRAGGTRARLGFVITTGDMTDNMQKNEVQWYRDVLDGKQIDPFSGDPITTQCQGQSASTIARLNADVAARHYTGVQDYSDYPGVPQDRYDGFWDPNQAPPGPSPYSVFPRYPGLMDRAQAPFKAAGLAVPWYTARGNHDGLLEGNIPANFSIARALITSCSDIFPSDKFDPASIKGSSEQDLSNKFKDPAFVQQLLAGVRPAPPDADRQFVGKAAFKALHNTGDHSHGYGFVSKAENTASAGTASYYAFTPRRGFRFISLDTVAEGGTQAGNIDNPQYKWLARELDRDTSVEFKGGKLVRDHDPNRLIVVYGHHTLGTMNAAGSDESAGKCAANDPADAGCDRDPRASTPIHRGKVGKATIRDLLERFPGVVAYVAGHTHENQITPYVRKDHRSGFWEINTASHVDWPQQARLIQIMDNHDGTLSLFNTVIDQAAPVAAPASGPANVFTNTQLASLARQLAANDPQGKGIGTDKSGSGRRSDRNVELVIRDPRRLR
jgi:metallophosphoesterase (TIGR03767 family)